MPNLQELRAFRSGRPEVDDATELRARDVLLRAALARPAKRHVTRRTIAVACAALAVAGGGVAYAAVATNGPEPSAAKMESLDVLADYAAGVGDKITSFAGLRIDGPAGQIVVSTTNSDPASYMVYMKPGADSHSYRFVLTTLSYEKLLALRDQIIADRKALISQGIDVVDAGPDVFTDGVLVGVVNPTAATQNALRNRYGTDRIYVRSAKLRTNW